MKSAVNFGALVQAGAEFLGVVVATSIVNGILGLSPSFRLIEDHHLSVFTTQFVICFHDSIRDLITNNISSLQCSYRGKRKKIDK